MKLGLIFAGAAIAWGAPIYNVTDLGSLGGSSAAAAGLSSNGLAVGSATTAAGYIDAFSNFGRGIVNLGAGEAAGVNSSGQIAGTQLINGQAYATEWSNGSAQTIGAAGSYAMAINDAGEVAGMDAAGHAFIESNGATSDLGTIGGGSWSSAYAVNDEGEVAGYGLTASGAFQGFLWTPGGGFAMLGTLGGSASYAMAVNDEGIAAGSAQLASGYMNAAVWSGGAIEDLGTLGGTNSYAYGVNDSGEVVGYSYVDGSDTAHAFLYLDGVMYDLNSLIDPSSGWILTAAYAINGSGEIVGSGLLDGVEHAFLLIDPPAGGVDSGAATPEPATWRMLAIAGVAMISFRFLPRLRRRRWDRQRGR